MNVLKEFSELRNSIFSHNLAKSALTSASSTRGSPSDSRYSCQTVLEEGISSYWAPGNAASNWTLYLDFQEVINFNVLLVQEPIHMGQRIIKFHLDFLNEGGKWDEATSGTTVGYKRLLFFSNVRTSHLRFTVDRARAEPLIAYLGLYNDPFSIPGSHVTVQSAKSHLNGSDSLHKIPVTDYGLSFM